MPTRDTIWLAAALVALALAHMAWRTRVARGIAEDWLRVHRYRVRRLRLAWFALPRFAPRLFRNERRAMQFRAEVDDLRLGGTGTVWLRVYVDRQGVVQREPDLHWERMTGRQGDGACTTEDRWFQAQLALLGRVASGESSFPSRDRPRARASAGADEVEHVMALARRGLVTCDAESLDVHGDDVPTAVANVRVTDLGHRLLAEHAPGRR